MIKQFLLKQKLKKCGFQWITVTKEAIDKYRNTTKKNKFLSDFQINFKILREYYSGAIDSKNKLRTIVNYGYLKIVKDENKNIINFIHNSKCNRCGIIKDDIKDKINSAYASVYGREA